MQKFRERGIRAEVLSLDRDTKGYDALKMALYGGRLKYYRYAPLLKELNDLQKDYKTGKVDHRIDGSKDLVDSLSGCVYSLSEMAGGSLIDITSVFEDEGDERDVEEKASMMNALLMPGMLK